MPADLQAVGGNKIRQSCPVTLELRVRPYPIQTRGYVLALDVAYWQTASGDDEIRRAAGKVRRFVYGTHSVAPQSFDERLECTAIAMFGRPSPRLRFCDDSALYSKGPSGRAFRWDHA